MNVSQVAAVAFGGLVLLILSAIVAEGRGGPHSTGRGSPLRRARAVRRARQMIIAWVVGSTLLAGVTQRNLWPLSSWALMTSAPTRQMGEKPPYQRLLAVDDAGHEYVVDYRALEPFAVEELMAWMRYSFMTLARADQDLAARYLLERLNLARTRVRAGDSPGTQGRWLGPLRAPFHLMHPRQWTSPETVPATPFVALRVYGERWDLLERAADPARFTRVLLYEFHE